MDGPATRHSLLARLRSGDDETAWREFAALSLARRRGWQEADARDLCQEVLRATSGAIGRWDTDPTRGSFRGWLRRVARNAMLKALARRQREPQGAGDSAVQALLEHPAELATTAQDLLGYRREVFRHAAEQVKGEFAANTWAAFWRTAVDGLKPEQAAKELGLSVGAVYIARSRAMARLRNFVQRLAAEESP
jgi:RNA polymerase sigma factor (sigma-70 family)